MYDSAFRWWVQSVMPVVFDNSLSYYEVLAKLTKYIEGLTGDVDQIEKILDTIEGIEDVTQFTEMLESIKAEIGNLSNLSTTSKTDLVSAINEVALKADIAYWKPASGIPESDLSQSVQDKLNKTGDVAKYIINNKELKVAPNNNSPAELGLGTYSVPEGGIPWATLSQDVRDRIESGSGGTGGTKEYADLNNKPQINGHTLNAGNNTTESLGLGTYSKPSGGIPESDLSAEVQAKLNTSGGIADNQTSFVATRDYQAGELLYINGTLYKTKTDILTGTTMVPGNNIEVTDISSEIEKINTEIENMQSGTGPDSWSLVANVSSKSATEIVNFFEYFNAIGGEDYRFIVDPVNGSDVPYTIKICKRDGTVVHTEAIGYPDYINRYRFTFTPTDTGEYYCTFTHGSSSNTDAANVKVTIEYTQSQGISALWDKVNEASQLEPRVEALETLTSQQQQDIENIEGDVDALSDTVGDISADVAVLEPTASADDIGKFLKVKSVENGKVTEYEFGSGDGAAIGKRVDALETDVDSLNDSVAVLEPTATDNDVGKFLKVKTVTDGKVSEYEFGEGGSGEGLPAGGVAGQILAKLNESDAGWVDAKFEHTSNAFRWYVDGVNGDDSNDGSQEHPWKTMDKFFSEANRTNGGRSDIRCFIVSPGTYNITKQTFTSIALHITGNVDDVILNFTAAPDIKFYECHVNINNVSVRAPNATFAFDGGAIAIENVRFLVPVILYSVQGYIKASRIANIEAYYCVLTLNANTITNTDPSKSAYVLRHSVVSFLGASYNDALSEDGTDNAFIDIQGGLMWFSITYRATPDGRYAYGLKANGCIITSASTQFNNLKTRSVNGVSYSGFATAVFLGTTGHEYEIT